MASERGTFAANWRVHMKHRPPVSGGRGPAQAGYILGSGCTALCPALPSDSNATVALALQKAAAEAKSKRENIGLDRMAPKFPLPPPLERAEEHLMDELPKRVQLSGGSSWRCPAVPSSLLPTAVSVAL